MAELISTPPKENTQIPRRRGDKLTDSELAVAKSLFESGASAREIGISVNADRKTIDRISLKNGWKSPDTCPETDGEVWFPVEGYEGLYSVSDRGRIRREYSVRVGFRKGLFVSKPIVSKAGYHRARFCRNGKIEWRTVHSVVCRAFIGPRPTKLQINHIDGNKANNSIANLEYVTGSENIRHAIRTGLKPVLVGEKHGNSVYSTEQIASVKMMARQGVSSREISKSLSVKIATVKQVQS